MPTPIDHLVNQNENQRRYDPRRILVTLTPAGTLLIANDIAKDDPDFSKKVLVRYNAPVVRIWRGICIYIHTWV